MNMQQTDQPDVSFLSGFLLMLGRAGVCTLAEVSHLAQKKRTKVENYGTERRSTELILLRGALSKLGDRQDSAGTRNCYSCCL